VFGCKYDKGVEGVEIEDFILIACGLTWDCIWGCGLDVSME